MQERETGREGGGEGGMQKREGGKEGCRRS